MTSFTDAMMEEPNRFLKYPFEENPKIKNFEDFDNAFRKAFNTKLGDNAPYTTDDLIQLFETKECKNRIRDNTTEKEYEDVYGDGHEVIYVAEKKQVIKVEIPKIQSKGYSRRTKAIATYSRTKPRRFSPVEKKFIQARKQKKISPKQIIVDYNKHFAEKSRTASSIRTKIYKL